MKKAKFKAVLLILIGLLGFTSCGMDASPDIPLFSENYERYVRTLASDEFQGRAPTTPGGELTKDFIEEEFRRIGLQPGAGDGYRQAVPLVELEAKNISELVIRGEGEDISFTYLDQMMAGTTILENHISLQDSELVFAGYGIVAPEYGWDDYKGLDVAGKTVVVLVNDPGYELQDPDLFTGKSMTYYGRWTYKYEEAARQGAQGVLIVHETGPAGYEWEVVRNSWSGPQYEMVLENGEPAVPMQGWLHQNSAVQLFERAGFAFAQLKQLALEPDFKPIELGMTASVSFDVTYHESQSHNIIGYLEGSQFPDETIIYMAHWDHLGMTKTPDGVEIYNGAVDNATGTAAIMVLAEKFAAMNPPPARSLVFIAVTAEESGLIGSRYYASNPQFPLEKTVGGINIDGMNVYGPTNDIPVVGYNASQMQDYFQKHARQQGRQLTPEPYPERGYFYRSDHFNLVRQGVPMFYPTAGTDFIGRDKDFTLWVQEDLESRYHSTEDVVNEHWDWRGIDQDLWLYFEVGAELANSRDWPQWNEGSEFRAVREQTETSRQ